MKVQLKTSRVHEVIVAGVSIGEFREGETWNGITELKSGNGSLFIVREGSMERLVNGWLELPEMGAAFMATPGIAGLIRIAVQEAKERASKDPDEPAQGFAA